MFVFVQLSDLQGKMRIQQQDGDNKDNNVVGVVVILLLE